MTQGLRVFSFLGLPVKKVGVLRFLKVLLAFI